jgi:ketose-bisphosphate aldolase
LLVPSITELIQKAVSGGYAIGYFESWNLESLQGVVDAAEETKSPVILGFNGDFLSGIDRRSREQLSHYAAMGRAVAESAGVPCGLLLNECAREGWIRQAVDLGFNLVMPLGPQDRFDTYVALVAGVVKYARHRGAGVEAEWGKLPCGLSNVGWPGDRGTKTDPQQAARLVRETDADILAVSVGNVHIDVKEGSGNGLDLDLLEHIRRMTLVPLVLHGGSGICSHDLKLATRMGVAKVNYGTYIKQAYLRALRIAVGYDCEDPHRLLGLGGSEDLMVVGRHAVKSAVLERIELLGCCGKA